MSWRILTGDCIEQMRELPDESIDAVVTDPPYELGFMGKGWDASGIANSVEMWSEVLRVLKPGGHLLSFGGTRTYHRMVCAVEDAGFEIRDQIAWMFGSGFPKSLDVSKAIDKAAGVDREVKEVREAGLATGGVYGKFAQRVEISDPATAAAAAWSGWGTALKPAFEPIVVARKPLIGTVAQNVLKHGTGAINVDGCRVGIDPDDPGRKNYHQNRENPGEYEVGEGVYELGLGPVSTAEHPAGRWPANVVLDPQAGAMLDEQAPNTGGGGFCGGGIGDGEIYGAPGSGQTRTTGRVDENGGASRFFYCAKTSRAERDAGLEAFAKKPLNWSNGEVSPGTFQAEGVVRDARNAHPTVKPIALMRWLIRLVTPPGGALLDPFNGSGSTGCAAVLEGFDYIGIDREPEYVSIAEARIKWWSEHPEGVDVEDGLKAERKRQKIAESGQLGMFDGAAA